MNSHLRFFSVLVGTVALAPSVALGLDGNLLANSDFETNSHSPGLPDHWLHFTTPLEATGCTTVQDGTAFTGVYGVNASATGYVAGTNQTCIFASENVSVTAGLIYKATGYAKNKPGVYAGLQINYYDTNGGALNNQVTFSNFNSTYDWTMRLATRLAPLGATSAQVLVITNVWHTTDGYANWDDVTMSPG